MDKKCNYCKKVKTLDNFFQAPQDASANWAGTSEYCKECHNEGNIKHGYGDYGEKYRSPETTRGFNLS